MQPVRGGGRTPVREAERRPDQAARREATGGVGVTHGTHGENMCHNVGADPPLGRAQGVRVGVRPVRPVLPRGPGVPPLLHGAEVHVLPGGRPEARPHQRVPLRISLKDIYQGSVN